MNMIESEHITFRVFHDQTDTKEAKNKYKTSANLCVLGG